MKLKQFILFITCIFLFWGCTKEIDIEIEDADIRVVIEGIIENDEYPWVVITRSSGYFEPVDSTTIINMGVFDAEVIVSDGQLTDTLVFTISPYNMPFYRYVGTKFRGEVGKTYSLEVNLEGKSYTANTTIPQVVTIDSVIFKEEFDVVEDGVPVDSVGYLWFYFQDPDTLGNYYRIFSKTLGKDSVFVHPMASVTDDKNVNGEYIEYPIYRGWNPNLTKEQREEEKEKLGHTPRWAFVRGETVIFKFCCMDAEHYEFWRTIEVQNSSDGNPFASPSSVYTNIEGGALGVWGGYGAYRYTVHIE